MEDESANSDGRQESSGEEQALDPAEIPISGVGLAEEADASVSSFQPNEEPAEDGGAEEQGPDEEAVGAGRSKGIGDALALLKTIVAKGRSLVPGKAFASFRTHLSWNKLKAIGPIGLLGLLPAFFRRKKIIALVSIGAAILVVVGASLFAVQKYYHGATTSLLGRDGASGVTRENTLRLRPFLIAYDDQESDVFLHVTVDLVADTTDTVRAMRERELILREAIYVFFLSKDLSSIREGQKKNKALRGELCRLVSGYLHKAAIRDVLFAKYTFP